jgi:predicted phosphodiesterase
MSERIALLSDVHGNSPALQAVLEDVRRAGCARLFVLGDLINGVDPRGCVDLLRAQAGAVCLKGNAEHYTLTPDLEHLPRREEPEQAKLVRLIQWYRSRLPQADLDWLDGLPDIVMWNGWCLAHDSPLDRLFPDRWRLPGIDDRHQEWFFHSAGVVPCLAEVFDWMAARQVSCVFCAHTHLPRLDRVDGRLICNTGSVGLPLDGDSRAGWVLAERAPSGIVEVAFRRVAYDVGQAIDLFEEGADNPDHESPAMHRAYREMLRTGIHWKAHLAG